MHDPEPEHRPSVARCFAIAAIWLRLAITDVGLRLFPARYRKRFVQSSAEGLIEPAHRGIPPSIQRILSDVRCAASHPLWFNMSCLRRSLVLQRLLQKQGIRTIISFGVRKGCAIDVGGSSPFTAHAWLMVVSPMQFSGLQLDLSSIQETFTRLDRHGG